MKFDIAFLILKIFRNATKVYQNRRQKVINRRVSRLFRGAWHS